MTKEPGYIYPDPISPPVRVPKDPEIEAIQTICDALYDLDAEARARVLQYAIRIFSQKRLDE